MVKFVLTQMRSSQWRAGAWHTPETMFVESEVQPADIRNLRERYQTIQAGLEQGFDLRLPHYYFMGMRENNADIFLGKVLAGRLDAELYDAGGSQVLLHCVPVRLLGEAAFSGQKRMPYQIALNRHAESLQKYPRRFSFIGGVPGMPYSELMCPENLFMPEPMIPQVISSVVVRPQDGGNYDAAGEKVAEAGLSIPVISFAEACLEAELLYRAALKYDLPTLLEERRAMPGSIAVESVAEGNLEKPIFWGNFIDRLKQGDVVAVNLDDPTNPGQFKATTWGVIIVEGEEKKVVFLSKEFVREEQETKIVMPVDFAKRTGLSRNVIFPFSLRITDWRLDVARVREIGLAQALVERDSAAELIL